MTAVTPSDGQPFADGIVAVLDETSPPMGSGIYYVVTTAVLLDPQIAAAELAAFFTNTPGRTRPFHWMSEGIQARQRMQDLIIDMGVIAVSLCESVPRRGQVAARKRLLPASTDLVLKEGAKHLIIETGDSTANQVDQQALLDHYPTVPLIYDWRTKKEPVLWIADAIGGMISDYLRHSKGQTDYDPSRFHTMVDNGVIPLDAPQFHQS